MARQRQQGKSTKRSQLVRPDTQEQAMPDAREYQGSFVDALNTTQQHTVPVLPAHNAQRPLVPEARSAESQPTPTISTTKSPHTSYARATRASGVRDMHHMNSLPAAPTSSIDTTAHQTMANATTAWHAAGPVRDTLIRDTMESGTRDAFAPEIQRTARSAPDRHSTGWRPTHEPSTSFDMTDDPDQDDADQVLAPGRPTFVLPAITGGILPAVRPSQSERQLAVHETDEPQAIFIPGASKLPTPHIALAPRRYGPRPFITQFLVAMVTVMTLVAVLTLASPLGKGLAFSNGFEAYANAMPWIPTPTPTPKPTPAPQYYGQQRGVNPGQQVIIDTIKTVFGSYSGGALNIARCESGYDPNAYNSYPVAGSHAEGVFQILYPSTWSGTSYARYSPYDYNANIRAAYEIFHNDGNSWREWECRP